MFNVQPSPKQSRYVSDYCAIELRAEWLWPDLFDSFWQLCGTQPYQRPRSHHAGQVKPSNVPVLSTKLSLSKPNACNIVTNKLDIGVLSSKCRN